MILSLEADITTLYVTASPDILKLTFVVGARVARLTSLLYSRQLISEPEALVGSRLKYNKLKAFEEDVLLDWTVI
jgi:hypothetical protein